MGCKFSNLSYIDFRLRSSTRDASECGEKLVLGYDERHTQLQLQFIPELGQDPLKTWQAAIVEVQHRNVDQHHGLLTFTDEWDWTSDESATEWRHVLVFANRLATGNQSSLSMVIHPKR